MACKIADVCIIKFILSH